MRQMTQRKALIIGGGIAGPVLGMFLHRLGIPATIYEARSKPNDRAGAFLNLAPNGLAVLETLGIREEITARGTPTTSIVFQNHRGKRLGVLPETTVLLKRGQLNRGLREAAARHGIPMQFGKRLSSIETPAGGGVIARFEDGTEAKGDFLVGCDGIHSRTRRSVIPDAPEPQYTGIIDSGGFTRTASVPPSGGVMRMTFGRKGFFGYQAVPTGEVYWFHNSSEPVEPDRTALQAIPSSEWRQRLLEVHRGDAEPIAQIIGSTEGAIERWPVYDVPSLPTWHRGPVCLIGDAAHAISPHVGQGASLALEDAIELARCLRDLPDVQSAFAGFERLRRSRVEKMVREARRTGNRKAASNPVTRGIRDLILPFFLKLGVKGIQQVYAHTVEWEKRVA
jgi:2-polyprenyl-6-methoxyphenol hydroxylase-like FAD-dependent oxidoreductase